MELQKLLKAMAISLPLMALGACSSTSDSETAAGTGTTSGSGQYGANGGVEMGGASQMLSPEEQQRQKFEELRKDSIIYFDFDRSEIRADFADILQAHADYLVSHPNVKVLIEGHTDERGTPEYNIALGERRAKAVAKYLQGLGVLPSQMSIVSYGEEKPADMSHTEEGEAKNRRAVLVY
ncbi:peptidoglycan-associated lipoprotein Pal [Shewanella yunxiaonensis]|uniref:Peptidoglycan-associated lipoprotein n=1 Tax=Shewanella yunxiaonensis TaxID=2829809 RepID=A0ABX7YWZ1_9GAMM|nr:MULTISPECIES: peptidoglycan-associated lipoprotein Pal [Shewanella]MDF0535438.1 peptidoglycan-associated lipoprotein Pal [Shewanella sp. A32]QUN07352.1 peptidoglycan-associated lipoprotein Pal [Shewanella yunxiaonensis]